MDVELLRTFIEVYQTRHFGKAAENLYLTQSAVSARIRQLEEELGVRLFMRDRNNIQLTAAGQKLLPYAESMIASWNRARLDLAIGDHAGEHMAFAGVPNLWEIFIQEWLPLIRQKHPDTAISADCLSTETLVRRVIERAHDFGFVYEPPRLPELTVIPVFTFRLLLVSRSSGASLEQITSDRYIYVDWGRGFANTHSRLLPELPYPTLRVAMSSSARSILEQINGFAYLAEPAIRDLLKKKKLFEVKGGPVIEREVFAVHRQDTDRRELIMALLDTIKYLSSLKMQAGETGVPITG